MVEDTFKLVLIYFYLVYNNIGTMNFSVSMFLSCSTVEGQKYTCETVTESRIVSEQSENSLSLRGKYLLCTARILST